jgi:hypothetical protein
MVSTLQHEQGKTLDADYVRGQVNYQYANAALYRYEIAHGTDPDLKAFAHQPLPKIEDHLERALKLQGAKAQRRRHTLQRIIPAGRGIDRFIGCRPAGILFLRARPPHRPARILD